MSFVHLHTHSHYSILEGLPKPKDYVKKAKELGMSAVAITDTGNIHGCMELYKTAKAEGITPILGVELFIRSRIDPNLQHKIVLLALSFKGYQNIIELVSKAALENPGRTPVLDFVDLNGHVDDIVCLSGPISGEIPFAFLSGKSETEIYELIKSYQETFGKDNFFLELLLHDDIPKQDLITKLLIDFGQKYNVPLVACQNTYYIDEQDAKTQDIIMALGTGHEIENPDRPTLSRGNYSFLTQEQMQEYFGYIPQALENTQKIAERVSIEIEMGGIRIPKFELPEEHFTLFQKASEIEENISSLKKLNSDEWYLRYLSYIGLNWRYDAGLSEQEIFLLVQKQDKPGLKKALTESSPEELKILSLTYYTDTKNKFLDTLSQDLQDKIQRLEYELVVVHEMGFDAYFLIVADYIGWARKNDIPVGPGRGSAAGSLMAYLSGITDIDPLPYDLLFERFLNPARISMPDIDTDFADNDRDKVVAYCREKYGADHVAQICTFGTFAARAAVKDVGRVMGVSFGEMNELAKLIPEKPGTKLAKALEESIEFKNAYEASELNKNIIDAALKIEGNVRQLGVHACAVIIAPEPMTHFTALTHPPKDAQAIVTQYSAYPLEDLGLLKMDFLGLRNLTIIKRAQKIIKNHKNIDLDILKVPLDDPKVFEVFAKGDTTGVFQFESDGMRKYLKDLSPDTFEDLIAMVSLYRPGPLAYIPSYVERKHGREAVEYMLPKLREILEKKYSPEEIEEEKRKLDEDLGPILNVSYGIAVYQEQLMFIVQYMAGFSLGEADLLRRGVGKKIASVVEKLKVEFIQKAETYKGYKPETSQFIYEEMIQPAANYSFNKSHAACYAFIAYQTAYLKAHYGAEFLTSMMVSDEENMDRIVLEVGEAQSKGIEILRPDINESLKHFTYLDDAHIRFGLKAIKGLGDGPIDAILQSRSGGAFKNIDDFIKRAGSEVLNKKSLEALIYAGAMDQFGDRKALLASIDSMIRSAKNEEKKKFSSQIGLFDMGGNYDESFQLEKVNIPMRYEEKLFGEKEVLGYMVSGHPLDGLARYCERRSRNTLILKKDIPHLKEEHDKNPEKFKEKLQKQYVNVLGVIMDFRKIITKNGKNMLFVSCEGFDYDFEVTIFDRDYEAFKSHIEIGKIVIIEGSIDINFEYGRRSVRPKKIVSVSLSQVRDQARDMGYFDSSRRIALSTLLDIQNPKTSLQQDEISDEISEEISEPAAENFEENLDHKISENQAEKSQKNPDISKYIIEIPRGTTLEQIHALKDFLLTQESGEIQIYILLGGREVDTKIALNTVNYVTLWIEKNL